MSTHDPKLWEDGVKAEGVLACTTMTTRRLGLARRIGMNVRLVHHSWLVMINGVCDALPLYTPRKTIIMP